ncbi:MAG TPA: hypothetical protein VN709_06625 [Terriglobales bacterium]|nr:hypothetical protein [Terriglobales bacterium]
MIVAMLPGASEQEIEAAIGHLIGLGFDVHRETGLERTVLACLGMPAGLGPREAHAIEDLNGVASVHRITLPYRLSARRGSGTGTRGLAVVEEPPAGCLVRAPGMSLEELLIEADRRLASQSPGETVTLCEAATRTSLDIASLVQLKEMTHLAVFADVRGLARRLRAPLARAAAAAGADGIIMQNAVEWAPELSALGKERQE